MKNTKTKKEMDVVFLLDRSGSMAGLEQDTIGGYNSYLEKQRNNKMNTKVTTVLFDNQYELLHDRVLIQEVKDITNKEYYVRGCTALLDAIGITITNLDRRVKDNKVLFVITTDGLENASREFTKEKIKSLIDSHPSWEFLYIGANIDSYSEGTSLGISKKNISNYSKSKESTSALFECVGDACMCLYEDKELSSAWKSKLEDSK